MCHLYLKMYFNTSNVTIQLCHCRYCLQFHHYFNTSNVTIQHGRTAGVRAAALCQGRLHADRAGGLRRRRPASCLDGQAHGRQIGTFLFCRQLGTLLGNRRMGVPTYSFSIPYVYMRANRL